MSGFSNLMGLGFTGLTLGAGFLVNQEQFNRKECGDGFIGRAWKAIDPNNSGAGFAETVKNTVPFTKGLLESSSCDTLNYAELALFGLAGISALVLGRSMFKGTPKPNPTGEEKKEN